MKTKGFILLINVIVISLMQSCTSSEKEEITETADIVANTKEFANFIESSDTLKEKILNYTKILSDDEFDKLMNNLNNDECMGEVIEKAGVSNDIKLVANSKDVLVQSAGYLKLNTSEQTDLFVKYAFKQTDLFMKCSSVNMDVSFTRASANDCDLRRQSDYSWARAIADLGLIGCTCLVEVPPAACVCYATVMLNYANDIRLADRAYEDCIKTWKKGLDTSVINKG